MRETKQIFFYSLGSISKYLIQKITKIRSLNSIFTLRESQTLLPKTVINHPSSHNKQNKSPRDTTPGHQARSLCLLSRAARTGQLASFIKAAGSVHSFILRRCYRSKTHRVGVDAPEILHT